MTPIEQYIRARAPIYGINPDVAVRVAMSEGGVTNPVRQSDVYTHNGREQSFGPFQLYLGGGVGSRALAAGIDPRKESDWQGGVDFALAEAAKKGWGQWHGAQRVGIGDFEGISGNTGTGPTGAGTTLTSNPVTDTAAPPVAPTTPAEIPAAPEQSPLMAGLGEVAKGLGGGQQQQQQVDPNAGVIAPSAALGEIGAGSAISQQAAMMMAQLMDKRRKRYGLSLTGMET
jgi:hypothetical protein